MGEKVKYRISDIAAIAGVSSGTVDRILHNRGGVSRETAKKWKTFYNKLIMCVKSIQ